MSVAVLIVDMKLTNIQVQANCIWGLQGELTTLFHQTTQQAREDRYADLLDATVLDRAGAIHSSFIALPACT